MKEIWQIFGGRVRTILPQLETEIKGTAMLNRTIDYLFVSEKKNLLPLCKRPDSYVRPFASRLYSCFNAFSEFRELGCISDHDKPVA
jgi:hypothetical protein